MTRDHRIVFHAPAAEWTEALPLGDGRLGAMCFGDPVNDRVALNHDTAWSGSPASEFAGGAVDEETARTALAEAEAALRDGDPPRADAAVRRIQQRYTQAYLPLADLRLRLDAPPPTSVRRELDLAAAEHRLTAEWPDRRLVRRSSISADDGVLSVHTELDRPGDLLVELAAPLDVLAATATSSGLELLLRLPADVAPTHERVDQPIRYDDDPGASVRAAVAVRIDTDGAAAVDDGRVRVRGATRLRVLLAAATTFRAIGQAPDRPLEDVRAEAADAADAALARDEADRAVAHRVAHADLYDRFELRLGRGPDAIDPAVLVAEDTAQRLEAVRAAADPLAADPGLTALLVHYGRYLLIASSRPGTLPANLQGIWNDRMQPPWSGNYTVNINTQMNYWGAEPTGLGDCHEPLLDLIDAMAERGAEVARRVYAAPGWTAHHNSDAWAYTSPVGMGTANPSWAFWPMAGLWLVRHYAERLEHGAGDELAERAWPVVRGAVEFGLSRLGELAPGVLGTTVSTSPEHEFRVGDRTAATGRASAMDLELLADAIGVLDAVAERLGRTDDAVVGAARAARAALAAPRIGRDGGIAEWWDDPAGVDPHHRHVSMLYGLHPGRRPLGDEELAAASRSLDLRGDEASGWSLVWKLALRARLGQPERVAALFRLLLRDARHRGGEWSGGLYPNLFAAHPPFQIDANLGLVGAVAECLAQSHRGRIELLPALPTAWGEGAVRGLIARPGVRLGMDWSAGAPARVELVSPVDREIVVAWRADRREVTLDAGVIAVLEGWGG